MVIEGTLGLTASHFLLDLLRERDLLPGFVDGYCRIAADEQRHIAYGTWFLREAVAADPAMAEVIRDQINELLPAVAESLSPPSEGALDVLGVEDGALAEFGLGALESPAGADRRSAGSDETQQQSSVQPHRARPPGLP